MNADLIQRIDPTVVCAIIAAVGTILSALIAWGVSRSTAKKELKKLRMIWEHEDVVSSDDDFAKMADSVARYIHRGYNRDGIDAVGKVNALRAKESGSLAKALDALYCAMENSKNRDYPDFDKIQECLSAVIEEKRKKQFQEQHRY